MNQQVFNASITGNVGASTGYIDLDLSSYVGDNSTLVYLEAVPITRSTDFLVVRPKGII